MKKTTMISTATVGAIALLVAIIGPFSSAVNGFGYGYGGGNVPDVGPGGGWGWGWGWGGGTGGTFVVTTPNTSPSEGNNTNSPSGGNGFTPTEDISADMAGGIVTYPNTLPRTGASN